MLWSTRAGHASELKTVRPYKGKYTMRQLELNRREALGWLALGGFGVAVSGCGRETRPTGRQLTVRLPEKVNECVLDVERLMPLRECMECCGPDAPRDEWNHSCIHPQTVAYSCGRLAYPGGPNEHDHDPEELALSRRLASGARAVCRGLEVNLSESSSALASFFVTSNRETPVPDRLTSEIVRTAFGGTIYPQAEIIVEPLEVGNRGWVQIADSEDGELHMPPGLESHYSRDQIESLRKTSRAEWEKRVARWHAVLDWFEAQGELHGNSFVLIGDNPLSPTNFGCVFPRLILRITKAGSLVGVCGHAVHT